MRTIERRNYPRRNADFLTVARRLDRNGEASLPHAGYSRNMSAGGLFFYGRNRILQGERVRLTIYPDHDWTEGAVPPRLVVVGKVVRIEWASSAPHPGAIFCGVAVEFDREPEIVFEEHDIVSIIHLMAHLPPKVLFSQITEKASTSAG